MFVYHIAYVAENSKGRLIPGRVVLRVPYRIVKGAQIDAIERFIVKEKGYRAAAVTTWKLLREESDNAKSTDANSTSEAVSPVVGCEAH